jgi:hypothetical protein
MPKIKSHKTVEQIAKKHRLDVSFIQKQLDMGEPIEHEHTGDHDLARDIALQHLDEIPDYYTRLKKMEASAKKEHKKFKDVTEEGLRDWFGKSKSKDGKSGWVNVVTGGTCASDKPGEGTPKCVSSSKRASMTPAERRSAARRKKAADPGQQQKSGAAKPTYVPTDSPKKKMKEELDVQEAKDKPGKGSGKKDACYHKVKSRYSVWPSAYASGALVKCRKVGADNWGTKSEAVEEQRYCPLCDKRETRSDCSYGGKAWDKVSIKDHEYSMARSELKTIADAVKKLQMKVGKGEGDLEAWVQSKITKAADYIDTAADYVASGEMEESIGFTIDTSAHKTARKREKIRTLTTKGVGGEKEVASKKLGATPELPRVKEEKLVDKIIDEMKCWPGYKKKGTQTLFGKKYNRCVKAENVTIEDADGNTFAKVVDLIQPEPIKGFKSQIEEATKLQSQSGNIVATTVLWRGKYYAMRMFFPQLKLPSRQEVTAEIQKVYPDAKLVHHSVSEFTPGQPIIQAGLQGGSLASPGPSKKYVKPYGEEVEYEEVDEDWQKVNRQDKTDGLSPAAVKAYRRENPGSKLQTAVTEKNPTGKRAGRRKNFCRRMKGMKSKLTSAETARDPDSRINKALRRWNCN